MWNIFNRDQYKDFQYNIDEYGRKIEFSTLTLHDGLHKTKYAPVSVFRYEKSCDTISYDYASRNLQRLKTLRHPNILTFVDGFEDEDYVFIVTERVTPLLEYLANLDDERMKNEYLSWGVVNVAKALDFCRRDGKFYHNNVGHNAVFVNRAGEWKLGEFGFASESDSAMPGSRAEQMKNLGIVNPGKSVKPGDADVAGISILIAEMFNQSTLAENPLKNSQRVPESMRVALSLIMEAKEMPSPQELIFQGRQHGSYFQNDFIDKISFLEEFHTKIPAEKAIFFKDFHKFVGQVPENVAKFKILPSLAMAYEYGCEGVHLIPTLLEFFRCPDPGLELVAFIVRLFRSSSRATRKMLLEHTEKYINKIPQGVINDDIFPLLATGFRDGSAAIRLETIKSIQHYVTKLQNNRINRELLPHLAGRLVDETEGDIRRASVETIGNIASYVDPTNRKDVLLTVYTKAMKDAHPATRGTAVKYLLLSQEYFTPEDTSKRILPALCCLTLDREQCVRRNVFFVMKELLAKLECIELSADCEEPTTPGQKTWTEWAMSALPTKLSNIFKDDKTQNDEDETMAVQEKDVLITEKNQTQGIETRQQAHSVSQGNAESHLNVGIVSDTNCGDQENKVGDKMENETKQVLAKAATNSKSGNSSKRPLKKGPRRLATRINHKEKSLVE